MKILFENESNHLGTLIADSNLKRIIALSTSDVFFDKSLIYNFWKIDSTNIDNGFQAHLYTKEDDILVVRIPFVDDSVVQKVSIAIRVNYDIWNRLIGATILSHEDSIVLVSDHTCPNSIVLPKNFSWYQGEFFEAAASLFKNSAYSLLAFTFSKQVLKTLDIYSSLGDDIKNIAHDISSFMDKNSTFELFQKGKVDSPKTCLFTENKFLNTNLDHLFTANSYVFKPSGGAAGIGIYCNKDTLTSKEDICRYVMKLKNKGELPNRFQIQEYVRGIPYGASAYFKRNGEFEILEIHEQIINENGKFIGGRWTDTIMSEKVEFVKKIYSKILNIVSLNFTGLLCIDFIDDKVIEVNPRLTASGPISHILKMQNKLKKKFGNDFCIKQIDVNTGLNIPFEIVSNGILYNKTEQIWKQHKVICLPQGLNPFGTSRMVFINDNLNRTAQKEFMKNIQMK